MTTELTLREKVLADMTQLLEDDFSVESVLGNIATHLENTGAPAYIRVADDLRGVVREEGVNLLVDQDGAHEVNDVTADYIAGLRTFNCAEIASYLGQFDKRESGDV